MISKKIIVTAFLEWFKNDQHSGYEDIYSDIFKKDYLENLSEEKFIAFFKQFAKDGGKIQSGGARTASKFIDNVKTNFQDFKFRIIAPFGNDFDFKNWLIWAVNFNYLGQGLATIILNRIDKKKYVIVNNKSVAGLKKLGFTIPEGNFFKKYNAIEEGEKALLAEFPELENLYRVDALMHFIIGTDEGIKLTNSDLIMDYFDLTGMQAYALKAGEMYSKKDPAANWYYDTREKLKYLVNLLSKRINKELFINYSEQPNGLAGKGKIVFKNYVLIGFAPDNKFPKGELFIKMAFHTLDDAPVFDIEFDINDKLKNRPYAAERTKLREQSRKTIIVDEHFPNDWNSLLQRIQGHIQTLISEYGKIVGNATGDSDSNGKHQDNLKDFPMNSILYGSPGTGKTFHSVSHSVAIVENKTVDSVIAEERELVKNRFDQYVKEGQIVFCTFHQSMGYEDFIEGIKPIVSSFDEEIPDEEKLSYTIEDGIFKRICTDASFSFIQQNLSPVTEKVLDFSIEYDRFVDSVNDQFAEGKKPKILTISGQTLYVESISQKNNIVIRHINGTRSYIVSKQRLSKISKAFTVLNDVSNINEQFRVVIGGSNASAYWSVLNAIRNQSADTSSKQSKVVSEKVYTYEEKRGIIESLNNNDYKIANPKKYVLIIDEINRGNVSQIFGELITLIEEDKRLGQCEALKAILPYSKDNFGVPCNLHIIGTMNTADRSVEALDTALRRRFSFLLMAPKPNLLQITEDGINLPEMLRVLNSRLSILKDDDHKIGHAWLWNLSNVEQLKDAFGNKILPLLQEYFYNDYEKLGLVLGDAFFEPHVQVNSDIFASFSGDNGLAGQYDQSWQYQLKSIKNLTIEDFKSLVNSKDKPKTDEE